MARSAAPARKKNDKSEVPEWLVTFADLMSILVCFFVLIISFSIQDERKLQIVAGSMRDAFGFSETVARAGVIEREGTPQRDFLKLLTQEPDQRESQFETEDHNEAEQQGPETQTFELERAELETRRAFPSPPPASNRPGAKTRSSPRSATISFLSKPKKASTS